MPSKLSSLFAGIFEGIKTVDYPYRFTKTGKQDTSQMQTKQKPQTTHIFTQRLIEISTDRKRQKHMQTQKCKN